MVFYTVLQSISLISQNDAIRLTHYLAFWIQNVGVYWTDTNDAFGPFEVEVTDMEQTEEFSTWTYELKYKNKVKIT